MLADHAASGADMTVGCIEVPLEEASGFGVMAVDAEPAHRALRREAGANRSRCRGEADVALASMGIYVFNAKLLYEQLVRDADDPKSSHDFGKDIIPWLIERGYRVRAHRIRRQLREHERGRARTGATWAPSTPTGRRTWS